MSKTRYIDGREATYCERAHPFVVAAIAPQPKRPKVPGVATCAAGRVDIYQHAGDVAIEWHDVDARNIGWALLEAAVVADPDVDEFVEVFAGIAERLDDAAPGAAAYLARRLAWAAGIGPHPGDWEPSAAGAAR